MIFYNNNINATQIVEIINILVYNMSLHQAALEWERKRMGIATWE